MIVLASTIAALVAALAFGVGAPWRGMMLILIILFLWLVPRIRRLSSWTTGSRRSILALIAVAFAVLALFWPTPLFIIDYMDAVQP